MPKVDYAILCDFVRTENGLAHVIAAGVDTVHAAQVPTAHNFGFLVRLTFTEEEAAAEGPPIEIVLVDPRRRQLLKIEATGSLVWDDSLPAGWPAGGQIALNFGVPLPVEGIYAFRVKIGKRSVAKRQFRVLVRPNLSAPSG